MASTNKTQNLNLNQWIGTDKPKRTDFNHDNSMIDNICGTHMNDKDIHIHADERLFWNTQVVTGLYFGTGKPQMEILLGFNPKAVIVFAHDRSLGITDKFTYSGIATEYANTVGITTSENGFTVYEAYNSKNGITPTLNSRGVDYSYIAFKYL